jgi:hypothetical protein
MGEGNMSLYSNYFQSLPAFTCRCLYLPLPALDCRCLYLPLSTLDCARKRLRARRASVQCRGDVGECENENEINKRAFRVARCRLSGVELL